MAKTSVSAKSNKKTAPTNKKKSVGPKKPTTKGKAKKPVALVPPECTCTGCEACSALPTGVWGLMYRNAAGECVCLPFEGEGAMYLKGDENGPYWANS